jgi:gliding motility-associated-like protein
VVDANNCKDTLVHTITCRFDLYVPEIFSPNGDGKNDKFEIKAIGDYPNISIQIFNRWGSLVYTKPNYNNEWDGRANVGDALGTSALPAGTYFVVLEFGDGKTEPYKGYVMLEY